MSKKLVSLRVIIDLGGYGKTIDRIGGGAGIKRRSGKECKKGLPQSVAHKKRY